MKPISLIFYFLYILINIIKTNLFYSVFFFNYCIWFYIKIYYLNNIYNLIIWMISTLLIINKNIWIIKKKKNKKEIEITYINIY